MLRVVNGEVGYIDLNEGLLLDWMLRVNFREVVDEHTQDRKFVDTLKKLGISRERVEEVTEGADGAKRSVC